MRHEGPLTRKEEEILGLLAEYSTYEEISSSMQIGMGTLYCHLYRIMCKIGMHKKELLIRYAIEHGYRRKRSISA